MPAGDARAPTARGAAVSDCRAAYVRVLLSMWSAPYVVGVAVMVVVRRGAGGGCGRVSRLVFKDLVVWSSVVLYIMWILYINLVSPGFTGTGQTAWWIPVHITLVPCRIRCTVRTVIAVAINTPVL